MFLGKKERNIKEYIFDQPILEEPTANAPRAQKDAYNKHANDSVDVTYLMLECMESELQK